MYLGQPVWTWLLFIAIIFALLAFDLGVFNRKDHLIPAGESLLLSAGYIAVALIFGGFVWWSRGPDSGIDYFTAYIVEKTLSLDNVFVISLIFSTLAIPAHLQHRVLFYGVLGVVVTRAVIIGLGAALVAEAQWLLFLFGGFLVFTGIRMWVQAGRPAGLPNSRLLDFLRSHLRITSSLRGNAFLVREPAAKSGRPAWHATPLLLALLTIELVDVVFAVDSVPAILAITTDTYIIYTSNIFAVLGLRALYFALAASIGRFHYLKYALALVLIAIGAKIFANQLFGKIDPLVSLGVTLGLIAGGIVFSLWKTRGENAASERPAQ